MDPHEVRSGGFGAECIRKSIGQGFGQRHPSARIAFVITSATTYAFVIADIIADVIAYVIGYVIDSGSLLNLQANGAAEAFRHQHQKLLRRKHMGAGGRGGDK
jgi:hypothetical protein